MTERDVALDVLGSPMEPENEEDETGRLLSPSRLGGFDHAVGEQLDVEEDSETEAPFSMKVQLANNPGIHAGDRMQNLPSVTSRDEAIRFLLNSSRRLDIFCVQMYKYYTDRGMFPILLSEIMYLLYVLRLCCLLTHSGRSLSLFGFRAF